MEEKKSLKANLDNTRLHGFLLGFVVALTCMFVGLELAIEPDDPLDDPDLLARLDNEQELSSFLKDDHELELAPKAEEKPTLKLKVVEDETSPEEMIQQDEPVESDLSDDMEAVEEEEEDPEPPKMSEEEEVKFRIVRDLPQFPGGPIEFMKWLTRNLKYPKSLEPLKVEGTVVADFIVNTDGSVTDITIKKSLHTLCDNEVLRVLSTMPRWTPGIENDKPCRTNVCIPVVFRP